jgi:hypothetical protein
MPVQQILKASKNNAPKLLLPALILITPFLVFLRHNTYCLACSETWISLSGIMVVALLCSVLMVVGGQLLSGIVIAGSIMAFIDLQFTPEGWTAKWLAFLLFMALEAFGLYWFLREKFYVIATSVFATSFLVTVLQLALSFSRSDVLFEHREPSTNFPPRIIHLILDEHIGIEGIPTDTDAGDAIRHLITQFYLKNRFQLFGGAFSRYFHTHNSISNMLNLHAESREGAYVGGRDSYRLLRNKYFEMLSERKYQIDVLWPGYMNFCSDTKAVISSCVNYNAGNLHALGKLDIPQSQKLQLILSRYLRQSSIVSWIIPYVVLTNRSMLTDTRMSPLQWVWAFDHERTRMHSLNTLDKLESLWNNILALPHGTALVAHLLIPHYPYVARSDCSIRPPNRDFLWNNRGSFTQPPNNTIETRKERYQLYFEQLECLYLRLDELFDRMRSTGIYDDSIIVLHGDHGSKIVITEPIAENRHALAKQDVVDGFSTLFAMKLPNRPGGYDSSPWPLEQLFARFVFEAGLSATEIAADQSEPYVYLTEAQDTALVRSLYPFVLNGGKSRDTK